MMPPMPIFGLARTAYLVSGILVFAATAAQATPIDPARLVASIYADGREDVVWVQWLDGVRRGEWFSCSVTALYRRSAMPPLTRRVKDSAQSISTSRRTHKGWRSADLRSRRSRETPRIQALSRASRPTIGA